MEGLALCRLNLMLVAAETKNQGGSCYNPNLDCHNESLLIPCTVLEALALREALDSGEN